MARNSPDAVRRILLGGSLILVACTAPLRAEIDALVAQPTTYSSPAGACSLFVDPKDRNGGSGANYQFKKGDQTVWSGERGYTLRGVQVTDAGQVVGVAYREVPREKDGKPWDPDEFFLAVILDPAGHELLRESARREQVMHARSTPYAEQILLVEPQDRVIFRVLEDRGPRWWVVRLSTGDFLDRFDPKERMPEPGNARYVVDAAPIPQTPLVLLHWYAEEGRGKERKAGGRFTVVDSEARPVWTLDAPDDYAGIDWWEPWGGGPGPYFEKNPAIQNATPRSFQLRFFGASQKATFVVSAAGPAEAAEWTVRETGREAWVAEAERVSVPAEPLKYIGELKLESAKAPSPSYGEIVDFTFDQSGNIFACVRRDGKSALIEVAAESGSIRTTRTMPQVEYGLHLHWSDAAAHQNRFLVWRKGKDEEKGQALLVDLSTGKESPLAGFGGDSVAGFARFSDGGFVVHDSYARHYSPADRLTCFDAAGKVLWSKRSDDDHEPPHLDVSHIAATADDRLVVLNLEEFLLFDRAGRLLRSIDVEGAWGHRPLYISEFIADRSGGWITVESDNPPNVLWMNGDGAVRRKFSPRYQDGRRFDPRTGFRFSPHQRLWTCDGERFLRLTDDGVVDRIMGEPVSADALSAIAAGGFTVDPLDRLYAVSGETGAVHVFDRNGRRLRIMRPEPADYATVEYTFIAVTHAGDTYVELPPAWLYGPPDRYLRYTEAGQRVGMVEFAPRLSSTRFGPGWAFQPKTGHRCGMCEVGSDDRLVMVEPPDKVIKEVRKRPNGKWFSHTWSFAMASDGSMAVLESELGDDRAPYEVDVFSADLTPLKTFTLPPAKNRWSELAFDGRRAVIAARDEVLILDTTSGAHERRALAQEGHWQAFILSDGRELLLFDDRLEFEDKPWALHRYELPGG